LQQVVRRFAFARRDLLFHPASAIETTDPGSSGVPLTSEHFRDDDDLQDCLVDDASHVVPGDSGDHVGLIQEALIILGEGVITASELESDFYGPSTAQAVHGYKVRKGIVNRSYQNKADNIVGKMTIQRLDLDMQEHEKLPFSTLITRTKLGDPSHTHANCPPLQAGDHEGTPINPLPFGRKVNIYGDHETDYLGFADYAIDMRFMRDRELTWVSPGLGGLADHSVGNVYMRSSPFYDDSDLQKGYIYPRSTSGEIKRMAMPGCRFTFTTGISDIPAFYPKLAPLGVLMETVYIDKNGNALPLGSTAQQAKMVSFVFTIL
jgi:hypothetical protein